MLHAEDGLCGGGYPLYYELYNDVAKKNVVGFLTGPMPTQPLGWFKKPVHSLADLNGLKYRTLGLSEERQGRTVRPHL